ncbi:TPA: ABC transporter ATP-binding protein [bacterium]|nr:ABC transporter ATP-binding protein [bacterium]
MEIVININGLRKEFKKIAVIDGISLQLKSGDIFGLVGVNGSGKTTLIKILATIIKPTVGTAYILNYDISREPQKVRRFIGYLPYSYKPYYDLKVREYIAFYAGAYKIPRSDRKDIINDILELTNLIATKDQYIKDLSDGMIQRLGIARTLIHDPMVLLFDEPLIGLDPKSRAEIMEIIKELGNMGKTLIVSSGIISDIMTICNKVGIMKDGKIIISGDIDEINFSDYL